jgi:hypothetical protein
VLVLLTAPAVLAGPGELFGSNSIGSRVGALPLWFGGCEEWVGHVQYTGDTERQIFESMFGLDWNGGPEYLF